MITLDPSDVSPTDAKLLDDLMCLVLKMKSAKFDEGSILWYVSQYCNIHDKVN